MKEKTETKISEKPTNKPQKIMKNHTKKNLEKNLSRKEQRTKKESLSSMSKEEISKKESAKEKILKNTGNRKKKVKKEASQEWVPFEKTVYGMIKTTDGRYVKIIEIIPINFLQKTPQERAEIIEDFYEWLIIAPSKLQFRITTSHANADANSLMETIFEKNKNEKNSLVLERRDELIQNIQYLSSNEALSKKFFIIYEYEGSEIDGVYSSNEVEIYRTMEYTKNMISFYFTRMGNRVMDHAEENVFLADVLYKSLNPKTSLTEPLEQRIRRIMTDHTLYAMSTGTEADVENIPEVNYIATKGLKFISPEYVIKDGMYETYLYVRSNGYHDYVTSGWFELFTGFGNGVTVDMYTLKKERYRTIQRTKREKNIKESQARTKSDSDGVEKSTFEAKNAKYIKDRMSNFNEDLYDVFTMFTITSDTLSGLRKKKTHIMTVLKSKDYLVRDGYSHMEEMCKMSLPLLYIEKKMIKKGSRNFLTSSLASTYMFSAYEMFDHDGLPIGINGGNASLVAPNPFNTKTFNNGNMVILGDTGKGKTYLLMTLAYTLRLQGIPVYCILPEKGHEWKKMVAKMGGTYVELAPGSKDCINIMAIRPQEDPDKEMLDEYEEDTGSLLTKKIHQIITFLQLNMKKEDMKDTVEAEISTVLTKLYEDFGITSDNDSIWQDKEKRILKKMPILGDFYEVAKKNELLNEIVPILNVYVHGDAKNMNAQTNVDLDSDFVVISVAKAGKRKLAPFSFIAVDCSYDKIKADRGELCALLMDELWKMMINQYASEFVLEIYKIIRGYGGLAIGATQNLRDLSESEYGSKVLELAKIKFLLGMDKKAVDKLEEIADLTPEDKKSLQKYERGQALMVTNAEKIPIFVKAPMEWEEFFTTDPNRIREIREMKRQKKERV